MGKFTRKNSTGDAGEYLVGFTFAGKLGWAYRILDSDTGIDGEVEVFEKEEPTGRILKVQVKSTARLHEDGGEDAVAEDDAGFSVSVKKTDAIYWRVLALPVILCVVHVATAKVFFRLIDGSVVIPDGKEATFTVKIPKANELGEAAKDALIKAAPLRDFNPLTRLLEQAQAKLVSLGKQQGGAYAFDSGVGIRQLKSECSSLIASIHGLAALGGWIANEETTSKIEVLTTDLWRQVNRLDHESTVAEY